MKRIRNEREFRRLWAQLCSHKHLQVFRMKQLGEGVRRWTRLPRKFKGGQR